jgi:hypothetical protein
MSTQPTRLSKPEEEEDGNNKKELLEKIHKVSR